jgi:hypothetical protein
MVSRGKTALRLLAPDAARGTPLTPYSFLAALPAILGFAGFVVYQFLGTNRSGDEITRRIVDKLRQNAPSKIEHDDRLTGSQLERLLAADQGLQRLIGKQDFELLRQALHQQLIISLTVYSLAILFCALSVVLFVRQAQAKQKLEVSHWSVASTDGNSGGVPVDLDPLLVSWRSSGEPEDTQVYLENIQTSFRTAAQIVPSSANSIRFLPDAYRNILKTRTRGQANRIRAVMQAKNAAFVSDPVDLQVGLTVLAVVDSTSRLTVAAMIDNQRIPDYDFEAKIVIPLETATGVPLSIGPNISYRFLPQTIEHSRQYDWTHARGVYFGPDDARVVRFQFLVDDSLVR